MPLSFQLFHSRTQNSRSRLLILSSPALYEQKYNYHTFVCLTRAQATLLIAISLTHHFLNGDKPQQPLWGQNIPTTTHNTNTQIRRRSLYDSSYDVIKGNRRSHFQTRKNKPRCNIRDVTEKWNLAVMLRRWRFSCRHSVHAPGDSKLRLFTNQTFTKKNSAMLCRAVSVLIRLRIGKPRFDPPMRQMFFFDIVSRLTTRPTRTHVNCYWGYKGRNLKLTSQLLVTPRSRMRDPVVLALLHLSSWWNT
jgi:hypothetical protein